MSRRPGTANKSRIHLLDPATVNKIAAGEVVERPASVVKELVENSIDAGANSVRIEITTDHSRIVSIRVTDDGSGMSPEDAGLAFVAHATSKIADIGDLDSIHTLGFRGEALASIAAISQVTLLTRLRDHNSTGTKIVAEGGTIIERCEAGSPTGTSILVENLFFNTPARKKFQKSRSTELSHIASAIEGLCLAHPEISFRLSIDGRLQIVTDRSSGLIDTLARLYGSEFAGSLVPVESSTLPFISISGFVSLPSEARKDTGRILVAINGRYIQSPRITAAIREGYATLLPKDRYPAAFLDLEIDTDLVDVNVHPTKREVRLTREAEIIQAVREAVNAALLRHNLIPSEGISGRMANAGCANTRESEDQISPGMEGYDHKAIPAMKVCEPTHTGTSVTDRQLRKTDISGSWLHTGEGELAGIDKARIPALGVLGQFDGIYILASSPEGELILVDQHAAHERVLYEQVTKTMNGEKNFQELIVPFVLHFSPREAHIVRELIPSLAREGLVIEDFGRDTFLVRAVPAALGRVDDIGQIEGMIHDLSHGPVTGTIDERDRIVRIIACRCAIKAGTACTREQAERLLNQLTNTRNPFTCPHGRPTMIRFSRTELDRMFRRS